VQGRVGLHVDRAVGPAAKLPPFKRDCCEPLAVKPGRPAQSGVEQAVPGAGQIAAPRRFEGRRRRSRAFDAAVGGRIDRTCGQQVGHVAGIDRMHQNGRDAHRTGAGGAVGNLREEGHEPGRAHDGERDA